MFLYNNKKNILPITIIYINKQKKHIKNKFIS